MEQIFLKVLNMSITASWVIGAVILLRLLLRGAPRKYSYLLWSVVGFRLACPVSFSSVFSLFGLLRTGASAPASPGGGGTAMKFVPEAIGSMAQPEVTVGVASVDRMINRTLPVAEGLRSANPMQFWLFLGVILWCVGMGVMLLYGVVSYLRLCRRMRGAMLLEGNVWQSDRVCSPYVLGFVRPRIYIPFGLDGNTQRYVLSHERYHLKRRDHLIKLGAFLLLCVHWFNPLCWLAFHLMGRDMEMSCDEKVLGGEANIRKAYSMTLLSFASNRRFPAPGPLAFGENGVKSRIKHALDWKKPKMWVGVIAALLCLAAIAACAANPSQRGADAAEQPEAAALLALEDSLRWEGETVYFTIPADYEPTENWNIHIAGTAGMGDGAMSVHYFEDENETHAWKAGQEYSISLEGITYLDLDAWLTDQDGEEYYRSFSLLPFVMPEDPIFSASVDLNHDGEEELLVAYDSGEAYEVCVVDGNNKRLWRELLYTAHMGWDTIFLCEIDGEDYLLRYQPAMFQGYCDYFYALFTLEGGGEQTAAHREMEEFNIMDLTTIHKEEMDSFSAEMNELLAHSTLVISTDGGNLRSGSVDGENYIDVYMQLLADGYLESAYVAELTVELDGSVDEDVLDYAADYVLDVVNEYNLLGAAQAENGMGFQVEEAKLTGLTSMSTGVFTEQGLGVELYRLEYRLRLDQPENVILDDGVQVEDGWITEWESEGQPYLVILYTRVGDGGLFDPVDYDQEGRDVACLVGVFRTEAIEAWQYVEGYDSPYQAAAAETYAAYRDGCRYLSGLYEKKEWAEQNILESNMRYDRITFGSPRDYVVYRMGAEPAISFTTTDGGEVMGYQLTSVSMPYDVWQELEDVDTDVTFYLKDDEVYQIDVYGNCEMTGDGDATLESVLELYGRPDSVTLGLGSCTLEYVNPNNALQWMWFEVQRGGLTGRMGIAQGGSF